MAKMHEGETMRVGREERVKEEEDKAVAAMLKAEASYDSYNGVAQTSERARGLDQARSDRDSVNAAY